MKIYILDLVWSQDHFINLKFNRSLFYDVSRECSLEGKFEAVINRTHPAYLLKLEGKDKTFLMLSTKLQQSQVAVVQIQVLDLSCSEFQIKVE